MCSDPSFTEARTVPTHGPLRALRLTVLLLVLPSLAAGMVYIDRDDNLSRHPKSTAYWFSKYFFNAAPQPTFTAKQRQAAASFAAAKAGIQRRVPAEPLAISVGPAMKPIVKVAVAAGRPIDAQAGQQQGQRVAGRGFAFPLSVDVTDNNLFGFHLHLDGKKK